MNNVYLVVSEPIRKYYSFEEPPDDYCIAEVVVAKNSSQAKYLAAKKDDCSIDEDLGEMPKFHTELKLRNVPLDPQVLDWMRYCEQLGVSEGLASWLWTSKEDFMEYAYHLPTEDLALECKEFV